MLQVLDRLRTNRRAAEQRRAIAFDQLARRLATGESISEDSIDASLTASGRTIDELEATVESWKRRFGSVPLLEEETRLREELQHTHAKIPAMEAELKSITERVNAARQEAVNRQTQIYGRLRQIGEAKKSIEGACTDRVALDRLRRAREAMQAAEAPVHNCRSRLTELEGAIMAEKRDLAEADERKASLSGPAAEVASQHRAHIDRQLRTHESEVAQLRKNAVQLARAEADARRELADAEMAVFAVKGAK